jgi:cytochrome c oxidase subunit 2
LTRHSGRLGRGCEGGEYYVKSSGFPFRGGDQMNSRDVGRTGLAVGVLLTLGMAQAPTPPAPRVVRVRAERFSFTPSEIRLKTGETVELRLKSDDTGHGFRIADAEIDVVIPKRGQGEISVVFTGGKPGRYEFECSHMCGAGHSFMRGVIVVKDEGSR